MDKFNIFLIFPDENSIDSVIVDTQTCQSYLNNIKELIDRADCEKGSVLLYEESELVDFIRMLDERAYVTEFYLFQPLIVINELIKNSISYSEKNAKFDKSALYVLWDFQSQATHNNLPTSLKELYEYQLEGNNSTLLLDVGRSFYANRDNIFVFKDKSTYKKVEKPFLVEIFRVHDLEKLEVWFLENRTPRQLNIEDQRHNEQSPKYIKGKSPLLYDLSRDIQAVNHVQELLNSAIGDVYENKDLINYDTQKEKYIWFEYENENPQNQYHGYHLAKPKTHEVDSHAESRIPNRARYFIDLLKDI